MSLDTVNGKRIQEKNSLSNTNEKIFILKSSTYQKNNSGIHGKRVQICSCHKKIFSSLFLTARNSFLRSEKFASRHRKLPTPQFLESVCAYNFKNKWIFPRRRIGSTGVLKFDCNLKLRSEFEEILRKIKETFFWKIENFQNWKVLFFENHWKSFHFTLFVKKRTLS